MFGVGRAAEARMWHVDATDFERRSGAAGFLCSLMDALITLAAREGTLSLLTANSLRVRALEGRLL